MKKERIRHILLFNLKHNLIAPETEKFLIDGQAILSAIPTVENFELLNQVNLKNDYCFGFSMEFADKIGYDMYTADPTHVEFVKQRWEKEVSRFLEIDLKDLTF